MLGGRYKLQTQRQTQWESLPLPSHLVSEFVPKGKSYFWALLVLKDTKVHTPSLSLAHARSSSPSSSLGSSLTPREMKLVSLLPSACGGIGRGSKAAFSSA